MLTVSWGQEGGQGRVAAHLFVYLCTFVYLCICVFLFVFLCVVYLYFCKFACLYKCMFGVRMAKAVLHPIFGADQIPSIRQHTPKHHQHLLRYDLMIRQKSSPEDEACFGRVCFLKSS